MSHPTRVLRLPRLATCAVWLLVATGSVAGCATSDDGEPLARDEIERAKEEGRRQAQAEERTKAAAAQTERLQDEIEELQDGGGSDSAGSSTPTSPNASRASTPCGGGLSVNSVTTCPFARNVRDAYERSDGARVVDVYSPVTKRDYTMRCADGVPTICRGGDGAIVYIR